MGIRTITIKVCDRCGAENAGDESRKNEWGETTVAWKGHTGGRAWDGAAGGCNHEGKAWLCLACSKAFLAFMKGASQAAEVERNHG